MRQQVADRHGLGPTSGDAEAELRQHVGTAASREPSLVDELHDERRGPHLGDGADLEQRAGRDLDPGRGAQHPVGGEYLLPVGPDAECRASDMLLGGQFGEPIGPVCGRVSRWHDTDAKSRRPPSAPSCSRCSAAALLNLLATGDVDRVAAAVRRYAGQARQSPRESTSKQMNDRPSAPRDRDASAPAASRRRLELRADCERCAALCCVAPAFSASADFAIDKAAGQPCPNLRADFRCSIHDRLRPSGFGGCAAFDCLGAGQQVVGGTFGGRDWRSEPALRGADVRGLRGHAAAARGGLGTSTRRWR